MSDQNLERSTLSDDSKPSVSANLVFTGDPVPVIFAAPKVSIDGVEFYAADVQIGAPHFYLALRAKRGDQEAIEICRAARLIIRAADGSTWFNSSTLEVPTNV